jgi:hypothetical protein
VSEICKRTDRSLHFLWYVRRGLLSRSRQSKTRSTRGVLSAFPALATGAVRGACGGRAVEHAQTTATLHKVERCALEKVPIYSRFLESGSLDEEVFSVFISDRGSKKDSRRWHTSPDLPFRIKIIMRAVGQLGTGHPARRRARATC